MAKLNTAICLLSILLTVSACQAKSNSENATEGTRNAEKLASTCQNKILLLPQTHPSILGKSLHIDPENFEKTARSQFSIAKFLEKNKGIPVFSEQVSTDQTLETVTDEFKKAAARIKTMFPGGLPQTFENLTDEQKSIIARAGGDAISFILRNTDQLHRVVENDQVEDELIGQVSEWANNNPYAKNPPPEIFKIIFDTRENMALDQINNYIKNNPSQSQIILIYGSDHSFSFKTHSDKFSPECIVVPEEFQGSMTSPYKN